MKFDLDRDTGVDGNALAACGLETNLFGSADCGLVEAVSQLSHDAQHSNLVRRGEFNFEHDRALDSERLGFVRVAWLRFEQDFD
jgi:hypothetical protein